MFLLEIKGEGWVWCVCKGLVDGVDVGEIAV